MQVTNGTCTITLPKKSVVEKHINASDDCLKFIETISNIKKKTITFDHLFNLLSSYDALKLLPELVRVTHQYEMKHLYAFSMRLYLLFASVSSPTCVVDASKQSLRLFE